MKGIVDRFEGNYAVIELENGRMVNVDTGQIVEGVEEGDCVRLDGSIWVVDLEETKSRKSEIEKLMEDVFE